MVTKTLKDYEAMSDEDLGREASQPQAGKRFSLDDYEKMSDDDLHRLSGADEDTYNDLLPALKRVGQGHLERSADMASSFTKGALQFLYMPNDLIDLGSELLTGKRPLYGSKEAAEWAKSKGLVYEMKDPKGPDRFNQKVGEYLGNAYPSAATLHAFAGMLKAGKYIPEVVSQARSVWQRMLTEAANNPELIQQEMKAAAGAGVAAGTLKALAPNAPWWTEFLASLGGGIAMAGRGKPGLGTTAGKEERVAETLADLNATQDGPGLDKMRGLESSIQMGQDRLYQPERDPIDLDVPPAPILEAFQPTTAQVALTQHVLPDGTTMETRNLGPYEKAELSGSPELQAKLEGQARAINTGVDETFQNAETLPYEVEPSAAGSQVRQNLESAKGRQKTKTEDAYDAVNQEAVQPVVGLFDRLATMKTSRTEADRPQDMPKEVDDLLNTWRDAWPDDVLYKGQPLSYEDLVALRAKALQTNDPVLLQETEDLVNRLSPEKSLGLLKEWRTRVMAEMEADPTGKLKQRLGQLRGSVEGALDSFGDLPGDEGTKFRAASAEARKLKETFESGQVGKALEKEWGRYVTPESDVPRLFTDANRQPESWASLVAAAGDPSTATKNARRILQQRYRSQTTNKEMLPEGAPIPSASKMDTFLRNPDNRELLLHAYGPEHVARLQQLQNMAKIRETILTSPAIGGSSTAEKLRALEKMHGGTELDRLFASMTLRLGFAARAGRKATAIAYDRINQAMDQMYRDALLDPDYAKGLASRTADRQAKRARQRYSLYLTGLPALTEKDLVEDDKIEPGYGNPEGYADGGPVAVKPQSKKPEEVDPDNGGPLHDLLQADIRARRLAEPYLNLEHYRANPQGHAGENYQQPTKFSKGGALKSLAGKWYSGLERAIEGIEPSVSKKMEEWYEFLRGRPGVKQEELDLQWPKVQEMVGAREGPVPQKDILDLVRHNSFETNIPEWQSGQVFSAEHFPYSSEPSPLQTFSQLVRSQEGAAMPFEFVERPRRDHRFDYYGTLGGDPAEEHGLSNVGDLQVSLANSLTNKHRTKYGETSGVRLPGGKDYKETVLGHPAAQPMRIDSGHFGDVPGVGESQVSWALHHTRRDPGLAGDRKWEVFDGTGKTLATAETEAEAKRLADTTEGAIDYAIEGEGWAQPPAQVPAVINRRAGNQVIETPTMGQQDRDYMISTIRDDIAVAVSQWPEEDIHRVAQAMNSIQAGNSEGVPDLTFNHQNADAVQRSLFEYARAYARPQIIDHRRELEFEAPQTRDENMGYPTQLDAVREAYENAHPNERGGFNSFDDLRRRLDEVGDDEDVQNNPNVHEPFEGNLAEAMLNYRIGRAAPGENLGYAVPQGRDNEVRDHFNLTTDQWDSMSPEDRGRWRQMHAQDVDTAPAVGVRRLEGDAGQRAWDQLEQTPAAQPQQEVLPPLKADKPKYEGAKVTHIDELQSYRHQRGRARGYKVSAEERKRLEDEGFRLRDELKAEVMAEPSAQREFGARRDPALSDADLLKYLGNDHPGYLKYKDMVKRYNEAVKGEVPNAPYKKSWPLLTFRRMLYQAAQDGSDWLTWNSAEEVQKHGTRPGIAASIYDKELPTYARDEAKRLGLGKGAVQEVKLGAKGKNSYNLTDEQQDIVSNIASEDVGPETAEYVDRLLDTNGHIKREHRRILDAMGYNSETVLERQIKEYQKWETQWLDSDGNDDGALDKAQQALGEIKAIFESHLSSYDLDRQAKAWGIRLTPAVREKILKEGLPKFVLPGAVSAGALSQPEVRDGAQ